MDKSSLSHCCYVCTYHIVFIPKCRRKIIYGTVKKDIVEIFKKIMEMKGVILIEGKVCKDHVHLYVSIPPKIAVSEFVGYLKGKSTLMLFDRHPEYREKWSGRHFWARGYYVATVGNVNEDTILEYIRSQEESDKLEDGIK
jgi:putative transposase